MRGLLRPGIDTVYTEGCLSQCPGSESKAQLRQSESLEPWFGLQPFRPGVLGSGSQPGSAQPGEAESPGRPEPLAERDRASRFQCRDTQIDKPSASQCPGMARGVRPTFGRLRRGDEAASRVRTWRLT